MAKISPELVLYSNALMGKYVLVRSYELCKTTPTPFEYLYDHNLPTYDYIQKDNRKKIKVLALSVGNYEIEYEQKTFLLTVEIPFLDSPIVDRHQGDIIYKITLRLAGFPSEAYAKDCLVDYVNHCKTHVESLMENFCKDSGRTIKKYMYDSGDGGQWTILNITNKRPYASIFLPKKDKQSLMDKVTYFVTEKAMDEYARFNVPYKLNILLYGLPGTGKTSCIHAIASEIDADIGIIHFNKTVDDAMLTKAINQMSNLEKCRILVLEDIDSLFTDDRKAYDNAKNAVTLSGLLNCLDGLSRNEGIIVFMTTNRRDVLEDAALTRSCRMDIEMEFKDASRDQIEEMVRYYFPNEIAENPSSKLESMVDTLASKNCTTAILQQYFFEQRHSKNILELPLFKEFWDNYKSKKDSARASSPSKNLYL